jgi:hypothetical protein
VDFALGLGNPDSDLGAAVSPAWVHLRRPTPVLRLFTPLRREDQPGSGSASRRRGSLLGPIVERYGLNLTVVNESIDRTFRFLTLDRDSWILVDPSPPYAIQRLIGQKKTIRSLTNHGERTATILADPWLKEKR